MSISRWKAVVGFEGFYEVSNTGDVRSLDRWIEYAPDRRRKCHYRQLLRSGPCSVFLTNSGYLQVCLSKNKHRAHLLVHRMVAEAFIPNPEALPQVNHRDSDKTNNHWTNLEWCTASDNLKHSHQKGRPNHARGERSPLAKLCEADVRQIKQHLCAGMSQRQIATMFGISQHAVGAIHLGKSWRHV